MLSNKNLSIVTCLIYLLSVFPLSLFRHSSHHFKCLNHFAGKIPFLYIKHEVLLGSIIRKSLVCIWNQRLSLRQNLHEHSIIADKQYWFVIDVYHVLPKHFPITYRPVGVTVNLIANVFNEIHRRCHFSPSIKRTLLVAAAQSLRHCGYDRLVGFDGMRKPYVTANDTAIANRSVTT